MPDTAWHGRGTTSRPCYVNVALVCLAMLLAAPSAVRFGRDLLAGPKSVDFAVYYLAGATLVADQPDIYQQELLPGLASARGVPEYAPPYVYPPAFAAALRPLARLPYALAQDLWLALSVACLGLAVWLLVRLAGLPARWPWLLAGAATVALFPPVHVALRLGQVSPLLLLLCAGSVYFALQPDRPHGDRSAAAAGISVALATMVKVTPGLLLPYLAATKRWRILAYALAGLTACLLLGMLWGGGLPNTLAYFGTVLPGLYGQRLGIIQPDNQALSALFIRLFTPVSYPVAPLGQDDWRAITFTPLIDSQWLASAASWLSASVLLLGTGFAGLRAETCEHVALVLSMALLVSLLIASCTYYHMYVLLLLPLALLVRQSCRLRHRGLLDLALTVYVLAAAQRYAQWLVYWTSSAWPASFGLYAALLLWGALLWLQSQTFTCCPNQLPGR